MPTPFDTSFGASDLIEASQVSQFASPINNLENGSAYYAADAGSTDAYAVSLSPTPSAYSAGMMVHFKANTANTGAATLNVNGLGATAIKKRASVDLDTGDIQAGEIVAVVYDGTNFQMIGVEGGAASLDGMSDVSAPSPVVHQVLTYDGSSWVPADPVLLGPDIPPGSPNAADDEFTGSSLDTGGTRFSGATAWSWRNQGSATAAGVLGGIQLTAPAISGGFGNDQLRIIEQSAPSAPWRYRVKFGPGYLAPGDYAGFGLALVNSSNGKILMFGRWYETAGEILRLHRWNSVSAFNATVQSSVQPGAFYVPSYLEVESNGTTLTFRYSFSGHDDTFMPLATETISTHIGAVDKIGLVVNTVNGSKASMIIDWFRRVA